MNLKKLGGVDVDGCRGVNPDGFVYVCVADRLMLTIIVCLRSFSL